MIDFIVENWRLIAEFVLLVASIVLLIVKKKPLKIIDSVKTLVVEYLPLVIKKVEDYSNHQKAEGLKPYTSSQKLEMAVCVVEQYLIDKCGLTESELPLYRQFIVDQIEEILSTPQKKGEQNAR